MTTRTTIRLDEKLLREAKHVAADSGRTLTSVIEDALQQTLRKKRPVEATKRTKLPVVKGGGLCPGVNLDSTSDLLDLMEGR